MDRTIKIKEEGFECRSHWRAIVELFIKDQIARGNESIPDVVEVEYRESYGDWWACVNFRTTTNHSSFCVEDSGRIEFN